MEKLKKLTPLCHARTHVACETVEALLVLFGEFHLRMSGHANAARHPTYIPMSNISQALVSAW